MTFGQRLPISLPHEASPDFVAKDCGRRCDRSAHRGLGASGRILVAPGRALANSRSGPVLPFYGNSLDYPFETVAELVGDRPLASALEGRQL